MTVASVAKYEFAHVPMGAKEAWDLLSTEGFRVSIEYDAPLDKGVGVSATKSIGFDGQIKIWTTGETLEDAVINAGLKACEIIDEYETLTAEVPTSPREFAPPRECVRQRAAYAATERRLMPGRARRNQ